MNKKQAFTLLELLIAMSLSSFIILGLFQSYYSLMNCLERSRSMIITNRRVALVFNQIERDINCALIPQIYKEIEPQKIKNPKAKDGPEKEEDQKKKKEEEETQKDPKTKKEDEEQQKEKDLELRKSFFVGEADDSQLPTKIDGKSVMPFKNMTFVTTNALQVYGQRKKRIVRVKYALVKDKQKSKGGKECYNLERKETYNLENKNVSVNEFDYEQQKAEPIQEHIIAENIKEMFVEYVAFEKKKQSEDTNTSVGKDNEEEEEYRSSSWGDRDEYQGTTPRYINVKIVFWDEDIIKRFSFSTIFPVLNYDKNQSNAYEYDKRALAKREQEKKEQGEKSKKDSEDKKKEDVLKGEESKKESSQEE
jgi:prepilin-type N-terminal cleavage/methylation domain-containing protein